MMDQSDERRTRNTKDPRRVDYNRRWTVPQFKQAFYIRACLLGKDANANWRVFCNTCRVDQGSVTGEQAIIFLHDHAGHSTYHNKLTSSA